MDANNIIHEFVKDARNILGSSFVRMVLYGSYARGDFRNNSDIDLLLLTTLTDEQISDMENKIYDLAFDYLMKYGIDISIIMKNDEQYRYWVGTLPFYNAIEREGIKVG